MSKGLYISECNTDWVENKSFNKVFSNVLVDGSISSAFAFIVQRIEPGGSVPKHSHAEESLYYFVEGSGRIHLGDEVFVGVPGSGVYIPSWETHGIDNTGDVPIKYIEVKIPVDGQR